MVSRAKQLIVTLLITALITACTSATAPTPSSDCGGGVATGSGAC
jgi:hypothetical protein